MEIGTHCKYQYCKQKDFLPFNCKGCSQSFCVEHRTEIDHECSNPTLQQKAIVCPVCNKTIKYSGSLSESEIWEIHSATECDEVFVPRDIPRCSAINCSTQLKEINMHECKTCVKKVCLKHRFPEDHQCQQKSYNFSNPYNLQFLKKLWN